MNPSGHLIQPVAERLDHLVFAVDQILRGRVVAFVDIAGKAAHRIDPHFLQPVIFGGEIGVNLGVARNPPAAGLGCRIRVMTEPAVTETASSTRAGRPKSASSSRAARMVRPV